jgi:hypothetical protein
VSIKPETKLLSWACIGYEHPIGLGVSLCPRFVLAPSASYIGTTLNLTFAWDSFFVKAALLVNNINNDSMVFHIQSYAEYTLNHFVFWAGVDLNNIGKEKFSASPFIGFGYNF